VVRERVKDLGLDGRVQFLEAQYGIERFATYSSADVFALPSEHENFGITVAEAMSCGVPVIVSPEVALSKLVEMTEAGIVATRTPEDFAQAIDRLLMDDGIRTRMGRNGRLAADENFRWSVIAKRWIEGYRQMMASHHGAQTY
jgi:glycosyltransferase involved in cell wall biosynthesis